MGNTATHTMYMAKNETEFCQIAVRSTKSRKSSYVKISDFTNKNGDVIPAQLYYEYEVIAPDGYYSKEPDALLDDDHEWKYMASQKPISPFCVGKALKASLYTREPNKETFQAWRADGIRPYLMVAKQ